MRQNSRLAPREKASLRQPRKPANRKPPRKRRRDVTTDLAPSRTEKVPLLIGAIDAMRLLGPNAKAVLAIYLLYDLALDDLARPLQEFLEARARLAPGFGSFPAPAG